MKSIMKSILGLQMTQGHGKVSLRQLRVATTEKAVEAKNWWHHGGRARVCVEVGMGGRIAPCEMTACGYSGA
jgi:hypothetical protein